jgi:type IV secretion system protein VirB10
MSEPREAPSPLAAADRERSEVSRGPRAPQTRMEFLVGAAVLGGLALAGAAWSWSLPAASGASPTVPESERTLPPRIDLSGVGHPACLHPELGCQEFAKALPDAPPAAAPAPEERGAPEQDQATALWAEELRRRALEEADRMRELEEKRRRSSMVVLDHPASPSAANPEAPAPSDAVAFVPALAPSGARRGAGQGSREDQLLRSAELETVETVRAQRIANPDTTVPQGTLIRATLETGIQSDLPGMVRAQVRDPVYSFAGQLMVPRGSSLIGRYESGLVRGQTRVFVVWTRLLRPDGVSMALASPATDELGRSGLPGEVRTHFLERFSGSLLLSLVDGGLGVAAARAQDQDGPSATVVNAGGQSFRSAAELALENSVNIPPTVEIPRGTAVQVFVARDLDFAEPVVRESSAQGLPQ